MKPKMKPKWKVKEFKRFDRMLLQISILDMDMDAYEIIGTITLHEADMESREAWTKAVEEMNQEFLQRSSLRG